MITIVTDSTAYFTKKEAETLGICVVPASYTVNEQLYLESFSDQNGDFERLLYSFNANSVKTSHPGLSCYISCFEEAISAGNEVLCITISSRLSGAYSAAHAAAKQIGSDKIKVLDSLSTAGGLYLLVRKAKELISAGRTSGEVFAELLNCRKNIITAFSVDDMTPLRSSGRLGIVRMSVGTILNIRPILLCADGVVVSDSMARGTGEIIRKLMGKIKADSTQVVVNYIGNQTLASNLYTIIQKTYPNAKITLRKMGPVLGIHLGLGVVSVSSL